jgi:hypothetical protein
MDIVSKQFHYISATGYNSFLVDRAPHIPMVTYMMRRDLGGASQNIRLPGVHSPEASERRSLIKQRRPHRPDVSAPAQGPGRTSFAICLASKVLKEHPEYLGASHLGNASQDGRLVALQ